MKKEIRIRVLGTQMAPDGSAEESVETVADGIYEIMDGVHVLRYAERDEELSGKTSTEIRIEDDVVTIRKDGLLRSEMMFSEGKEYAADYETPFGQLLLATRTRELLCEINDTSIELFLRYELSMNGDSAGERSIRIRTESNARPRHL